MQLNLTILETVTETAKAKASGNASWVRAIEKASEQLVSNPYICESDGGLLILSYSGETYHANGSCQCRAYANGMPCWHRAAAKLVKRYNEAEAAQVAASAAAVETTQLVPNSAQVESADERAQLTTDIKAAWHRARQFEAIDYSLHRVFGVTRLEDVATDDLRRVLSALTPPARSVITHTALNACARGKRSLTRFYGVPARLAHRSHS